MWGDRPLHDLKQKCASIKKLIDLVRAFAVFTLAKKAEPHTIEISSAAAPREPIGQPFRFAAAHTCRFWGEVF